MSASDTGSIADAALERMSSLLILPSAMEHLALAAITLAEDRELLVKVCTWMSDFNYEAFRDDIEHLTDVEASAYLKLLIGASVYRYLPHDLSVIHVVVGLSVVESEVVGTPLRRFFDATPEGYVHRRSEVESAK